MRTITLKYAGTCRDCGASLAVGSKAVWYGRGKVYGIGCHESTSGPSRGETRSTYTRFSSGAEVYTNRAGRCEDAPCCGCCS